LQQLAKLTGYDIKWLEAAAANKVIKESVKGGFPLGPTVLHLFDVARSKSADTSRAGIKLEELTLGADELCGLTGLTDRRHRHLATEGYIPQPVRGRYPFQPTLAGIIRFHKDQWAKRTGTMAEEKQRLIKAQRQMVELHLSRERGETLDANEVQRAWAFIVMTIRQRFMGMAAKLAPRLPFCKGVTEMEKMIDSDSREILADLSRPIKNSGIADKTNETDADNE